MAGTPEANRETGVRILSPDAEEARAVARAIASSTAGGILRSFQGQERTASEIATALNQPIPTIMYHLDALLEAGLIEVSRITYSVKGREVKKYRQSGQVFIVAPSHTDIREILLKYASLFGLTLFSAGFAYILLQWLGKVQAPAGLFLNEMKEKAVVSGIAKSQAAFAYESEAVSRDFVGNTTMAPTPPPPVLSHADAVQPYVSGIREEGAIMPDLSSLHLLGFPDLISGILIGGFLVIFALICFECINYYRKKRIR